MGDSSRGRCSDADALTAPSKPFGEIRFAWSGHAGRTITIGNWAAETGINRQTIRMRIDRYGWSVAKALTIKP